MVEPRIDAEPLSPIPQHLIVLIELGLRRLPGRNRLAHPVIGRCEVGLCVEPRIDQALLFPGSDPSLVVASSGENARSIFTVLVMAASSPMNDSDPPKFFSISG